MEVCSRDDEGDDDDGLNWIERGARGNSNERTDHGVYCCRPKRTIQCCIRVQMCRVLFDGALAVRERVDGVWNNLFLFCWP